MVRHMFIEKEGKQKYIQFYQLYVLDIVHVTFWNGQKPLEEVWHNFRNILLWFLAHPKISHVNVINIWRQLGLKLKMKTL